MKSIASTVLLFFVLFITTNSYALEKKTAPCASIKDTSDAMQCLVKKRKNEEDKMALLFHKIETIIPNLFSQIKENQTIWLDFRTKSCDLFAINYTGESLSQLQSNKCLVDMTKHRNKYLLSILNSIDISYIPEFSATPRWINILIQEYPDLFLNLGNIKSIDTDCDGYDEKIIFGFTKDMNNRIIIADSQKTGKPKLHLLAPELECRIPYDININKLPAHKPDERKIDAHSCSQKITFKTELCNDVDLSFDPLEQSYIIK